MSPYFRCNCRVMTVLAVPQTLRIEHEQDVTLEYVSIQEASDESADIEQVAAGQPATGQSLLTGTSGLTLEVCASAYITMAYIPQYRRGAQPISSRGVRLLAASFWVKILR